MSNNLFSAGQSAKNQHLQTHKYKSLLQKYSSENTCLYLTYDYFEYETSNSSWHKWNDDLLKL